MVERYSNYIENISKETGFIGSTLEKVERLIRILEWINYVYGMVIYDGEEAKEYSWSKGHFYFVDKPSKNRNPGYPLDSISIMPISTLWN